MLVYLEASKGGGSRSQIVEADDGNRYVIKFKNNPQGAKVLANELVANLLAQVLKVPCPLGVLAEIGESFLSANPELQKMFGHAITSGLHFGIRYLPNRHRCPPRSVLADIVNGEDIASVVALDVLTLNMDRDNDGNYLLTDQAPLGSTEPQLKFCAIDHGHCFGGPNWNESLGRSVGSWPGSLINELKPFVRGSDPFASVLARIDELAESDISFLVDQVPDEWGLSETEKQALREFLNGQKRQLRDILRANRATFPMWREEG